MQRPGLPKAGLALAGLGLGPAFWRRAPRLGLVLASLAGWMVALPAGAAGMSTHALVADLGRQALPEGSLKTLLGQHRASLLAGAIHPDGGYGSSAIFPEDGEMAERAHWEDFNDAFIAHLRDSGCAAEAASLPLPGDLLGLLDLSAVGDRCGKLIAFAFGNAAHGITDETWDSLFEPLVRERDLANQSAARSAGARHQGPGCRRLFGAPRDPRRYRQALERGDEAALAAELPLGPVPGIEYAMDMLAIAEQKLWLEVPVLVHPPVQDLVAVHARNRPELGVSAVMVRRAFLVAKLGVSAERLVAVEEAARMRLAMPWAAGSYYLASGGVIDSARMVARLYEHLWDKLRGAPRPPAVIGVHPENGELYLPTGRLAAEAAIRAFTGQSIPEAEVEAAGRLCLFDQDGRRVAGELRSGIYDPEWGHVLAFTPAADLLPDRRYTVVVTDQLIDHLGQKPLSAYSWSFRTAPSPSP